MIVCPNCRSSNQEEARFCMNCGRTLEPGPSPRVRPDGSHQGLAEIRPPKPPARWPAFLALGAMIVFAAGFFGWQVFGPDPCRDKFASSQFGYCLAVPAGWQADPARVGTAPMDEFSPNASSTTVLIQAADLPANLALAEFSSSLRQQEEAAGYMPGEPQQTTVGGFPAQWWDTEVPAPDGSEGFKIRDVVVVKDEVGWRIQLNDATSAFDSHLPSLAQMLRSWHFA
jgi:hypothetical protein